MPSPHVAATGLLDDRHHELVRLQVATRVVFPPDLVDFAVQPLHLVAVRFRHKHHHQAAPVDGVEMLLQRGWPPPVPAKPRHDPAGLEPRVHPFHAFVVVTAQLVRFHVVTQKHVGPLVKLLQEIIAADVARFRVLEGVEEFGRPHART